MKPSEIVDTQVIEKFRDYSGSEENSRDLKNLQWSLNENVVYTKSKIRPYFQHETSALTLENISVPQYGSVLPRPLENSSAESSVDEARPALKEIINYYVSNSEFMETEDLEMVMEQKTAELLAKYEDKIVRPILFTISRGKEEEIDALVDILIFISKQARRRLKITFQYLLGNLLQSKKAKIRYAAGVGLSYINDKESLRPLRKALKKEKNRFIAPVFKAAVKQLQGQVNSNGQVT